MPNKLASASEPARLLSDHIYQLCQDLFQWHLQGAAPLGARTPLALDCWFGQRLLKLYEAVRVLIDHQCPVEAGILVLSMLETTTDILYVGRQGKKTRKRLRKYYEHTDTRHAPYDTRCKLNEICRYRRALYPEIYEELWLRLSMIKHGNPASGRHLFSLTPTGRPRPPRTANALGRVSDRLAELLRKADAILRATTATERSFGEEMLLASGLLLADAFDWAATVYEDHCGDDPDEIEEIEAWRSLLLASLP